MPVRSLRSSVIKWPDAKTVDQAVRAWAECVTQGRADVSRIAYFGSYARGDWGVGSDLDIIIILKHSEETFERRAIAWDTTELPVPVDLIVYTEAEWDSLREKGRFHAKVTEEAVWVYPTEQHLI